MSCLTGDILKVNCSAQGDQTLRITWIREYAELPERRATVGGDGTLTVTQLVPEDAGKYFCTASSVGGAIKITADMNLIVLKSEWYILIFWLVIRQLVDDLREYTQKFSRFFFRTFQVGGTLIVNFSRGIGSCVSAIECEVPASGSEATGGAKPSHYRT